MLKLQFKDRRREAVWLVDQVFTIGKHSRNSLMVDHAGITDFHAELTNQRDALTLVNKSGGLGVWVNGLPISDQTAVEAGDSITLGELELELIDPKNITSLAKPEQKPKSEWSISTNASWLEKGRYVINEKIVIGRDPSCDLALPLEHLSRQHVALEIRGGQLFVKDLESANGTYLNGQLVKESPLKPGDKLKLDVVTFEIGGPTHDPHKTIIRTVSSPEKTKARDASGKAPTPKPNPKPTKTSGSPQRKSLAAKGKQDWISGDKTPAPVKKKGSGGLFIIIGLLLVVAASILVISQIR